jgi:putative FmdB family regulatory protein
MPNYDYICKDCKHTTILTIPYADRDEKQDCPKCESSMWRYYANVNVRTPKTSVSYVGQHGKSLKEKAIMTDLKKSAQLEAEAMSLSPDSIEYKDKKREARERKEGKKHEQK